MNEGELLTRIATTLKQEIAPAVEQEYPKTQAFMAAVVLDKLGRQLSLASIHQTAAAEEIASLIADLTELNAGLHLPAAVGNAIKALTSEQRKRGLSTLIDALYETRDELAAEHFTALLARLRLSLRREVERELEYAQ